MVMGRSRPLGGLDHPQERFYAYVSAIRRMRWFILASTSLSCVALLHIYLEGFSYQENQMIGYLAKREVRQHAIADLEKRLEGIRNGEDAEIKSVGDPAFEELEFRLAKLKYLKQRSDNTLGANTLVDRRLPLVGVPVPANDFLPVIAMMNLVLMVGVWLNIRSIAACVMELKTQGEFEDMKDLLRLHFTFTGLVDDPKKGITVGSYVQTAALILPALATGFCGSLDVYSAFQMWTGDAEGYAGEFGDILMRAALLSVILVLILKVTQACLVRARELDHGIRARLEPDPPHENS